MSNQPLFHIQRPIYTIKEQVSGEFTASPIQALKESMETIKRAIIVLTISGDIPSNAGEYDMSQMLILGELFDKTYVRESDGAAFSMNTNAEWTHITDQQETISLGFDVATGRPVQDGKIVPGHYE